MFDCFVFFCFLHPPQWPVWFWSAWARDRSTVLVIPRSGLLSRRDGPRQLFPTSARGTWSRRSDRSPTTWAARPHRRRSAWPRRHSPPSVCRPASVVRESIRTNRKISNNRYIRGRWCSPGPGTGLWARRFSRCFLSPDKLTTVVFCWTLLLSRRCCLVCVFSPIPSDKAPTTWITGNFRIILFLYYI